jgi:competence protein ComEC
LACAGFYVLAAGLEAPLVRGYVMFGAALTGYLLNRNSGVFQGLVIACFAILLAEPAALFDAGFQMSFMAAYGIITGMALWGPICRIKGFWNNVLTIILVSFFAQIGLYPLMALYFHKVSLISLLSNIVLVPGSGIIMGLGFVTVLASSSAALFGIIKPFSAFAVGFFIRLVRFFASFRYSAVWLSPPSAITMFAFFIFVFALLHAPLFGFKNKKLYCAAAGALLISFFGTKILPEKNIAAMFSDANTYSVILKQGSKAVFLVNPGMDAKKLVNSLLHYGFREIDGVFISTLARKDWSGLAGIAQSLGVKKVILPYGPLPDELAEVLSDLEKNGGVVLRVWSDESLNISGVSVYPVWRSPPGLGGYGGNDMYEGLDWRFSGKYFKVAVEDDGRRASGACGISGECRDFTGKKGETLEFEL